MSFALVLLGILLIGIVCVTLIKGFGRQRTISRLQAQGRVITFKDAIQRVQEGNGYLIVNKTNVSGILWWSPQESKDIRPISLLRHDVLLIDYKGNIDEVCSTVPPERMVTIEGIVRQNEEAKVTKGSDSMRDRTSDE